MLYGLTHLSIAILDLRLGNAQISQPTFVLAILSLKELVIAIDRQCYQNLKNVFL
jgi:hypothetical protein